MDMRMDRIIVMWGKMCPKRNHRRSEFKRKCTQYKRKQLSCNKHYKHREF